MLSYNCHPDMPHALQKKLKLCYFYAKKPQVYYFMLCKEWPKYAECLASMPAYWISAWCDVEYIE